MTLSRTYHIKTIADAFDKIPAEKIDVFLHDIGNVMRHHKSVVACLGQLARHDIRLDIKPIPTSIAPITRPARGSDIGHHPAAVGACFCSTVIS